MGPITFVRRLAFITGALVCILVPPARNIAPARAGTWASAIETRPEYSASIAAVCAFPGEVISCRVRSGGSSHARWYCSGGKFNVETGSAAIDASVSWQAPQTPGLFTIARVETGRRSKRSTIRVLVCSASLLVRIDSRVHAANPSSQPKVGDGFAPTAIVAAGGIGTPEHCGDVAIRVTLPDGNPAPAGVTVDAEPTIVSGGQGPTDGPNNIVAQFRLPGSLITDGKGTADIPSAFLSGNRTEDTVIGLRFAGAVGPMAAFKQVWNESADPWGVDEPYWNYDTPLSASCPMFFDDGSRSDTVIPITGHHCSIVTTGVEGFEWNAATGQYLPVELDDAAIHGNGYDGAIVWKAPTESHGTYTAWTTIPWAIPSKTKPNVFLMVDSLRLSIVDEDAYNAE